MSLQNSKVQFYRAMAMMYDAGLPLSKALAQWRQRPLQKISREISGEIGKSGTSMGEQMRSYPRFFTELECRLVKIGEHTGSLDVIFKALAEWFELGEKFRRTLVAGMSFPIFLFHFAALAIPSISFLLGNVSVAATIVQISLFLCPPYFLMLGVIGLNRVKHLFRLEVPLPLSGMIFHVPFFGKLCREMDYMRFFRIYGLALEAGLPVGDSIRLGADSCRNRYVRNAFFQVAQKIEGEGCGFAEAFSPFIPKDEKGAMDVSLIKTAELTGKTSGIARVFAAAYQREVEETLEVLAGFIPKAVYSVISFYMAFKIVKFWAHLGSIGDIH